VWVLSDLAVTGHPLWSLTNTRHTAATLNRVTGIVNVPEYIPRRIGEILRPPVLVGAALGGVLSLLWLRRRALLGAGAGVLAVVVFAAFATLGLPINTRYAFLAAAILCIFCGAGAFGWTALERGDRRRRWWMAGGALVLVALVVYIPSQYRAAHGQMDELARQQSIEDDLVALVESGAVNLRCGPVGVPNHAPIPLLALYLHTSPRNIVNAQLASGQIRSGVYVDPASRQVEEDYVLDRKDPHVAVSVPPGFTESASNSSWLIFKRCGY
jgi:cytochrome bd-type quinol oxidase subunit 1